MTNIFAQTEKAATRRLQTSLRLNYNNDNYDSIFVNISVDNNSKINGLFVKPFANDTLLKIERNITRLQLPTSL